MFIRNIITIFLLRYLKKNAITVTYDAFMKLEKEKQLHFLESIVNLLDVSISLKIWEYNLSRDDASTWWKGVPNYYLYSAVLIKPLEDLRRNGLKFKDGSTSAGVLALEGYSEKTFLSTIYKHTKYANLNFELYEYEGKTEIPNLARYINEKSRQGVRVNLTCDNDGNTQQTDSFIEKLERKCSLNKIFRFDRDFENSIPVGITKEAVEIYLSEYAPETPRLSLEELKQMLEDKLSFIKALNLKLRLTIDKVKLAKIYGRLFVPIIMQNWNNIINTQSPEGEFNYEIYEFLRFAVKN